LQYAGFFILITFQAVLFFAGRQVNQGAWQDAFGSGIEGQVITAEAFILLCAGLVLSIGRGRARKRLERVEARLGSGMRPVVWVCASLMLAGFAAAGLVPELMTGALRKAARTAVLPALVNLECALLVLYNRKEGLWGWG